MHLRTQTRAQTPSHNNKSFGNAGGIFSTTNDGSFSANYSKAEIIISDQKGSKRNFDRKR